MRSVMTVLSQIGFQCSAIRLMHVITDTARGKRPLRPPHHISLPLKGEEIRE
ncbi:hypothetical protein D3C79_714560 [compost metagenome]